MGQFSIVAPGQFSIGVDIVDAVLYVLRTGIPWRDLPSRFGRWNTVYIRYRDWCRRGVWQRIFEAMSAEPDLRKVSMTAPTSDATAPRLARGKKRGPQSIGQSRGGPTTKVHALTEAKGRPVRIILTPGQYVDSPQAGVLLSGLQPGAVVADKAYDADGVVAVIRRKRGRVVIPMKASRVRFRWLDRKLYRERNKVERFFCRLKDFRRCATRYDKLDSSFVSMIYLACAVI